MSRITTGMESLDKLMEGGLPSDSVVLFSGSAGTGKTLFGLNFILDGANKGEKCVYVSFNETGDELLKASEGIDSLKDVKKYLDKKIILKAVELGKRMSTSGFVEAVGTYPKIDRLVVDNVNKLLLFAKDRREYRYELVRMIKFIKARVNTCILICESEEEKVDTGNSEAFECDGVIHLSFLDFEEKPKRTLQICKMRYTAIEPKVSHEYRISKKGLSITKTQLI